MFLFATEDPVQLVTGIPTPALELTIHLYLALRLRISGALSPFSCLHGVVLKQRDNFTFYLIYVLCVLYWPTYSLFMVCYLKSPYL